MIVLQILMAIVAVVLIVSVMLQDGDSEGITALGASTGNSETFFGKNQTSSLHGFGLFFTNSYFCFILFITNPKIFLISGPAKKIYQNIPSDYFIIPPWK